MTYVMSDIHGEYEKVYLYRKEVLGEEHADTIKVKEKLEAVRLIQQP